jgi:hypothetical protein
MRASKSSAARECRRHAAPAQSRGALPAHGMARSVKIALWLTRRPVTGPPEWPDGHAIDLATRAMSAPSLRMLSGMPEVAARRHV